MPLYNYVCENKHELEIIESIKAPTSRPCGECETNAILIHSPMPGSTIMYRVIKSVQQAKFAGGSPTPKFHRRSP